MRREKYVVFVFLSLSLCLFIGGLCSVRAEANLALPFKAYTPESPSGWGWYTADDPEIIYFDDYVETHNGNPSIRLESHTGADGNIYREVDSGWFSVHPNDRVVIKVWIKTQSVGDGDPYGARIGLDFKGPYAAHPLDGLPSSGGAANFFSGTPLNVSAWTSATGTCSGTNVMFVRWGSDWTLQTYDFVVPDKWYTQDYGGVCEAQQICGMFLWLDAREENQPAFAWFADAEVYVYEGGVGGPVPSPTVTPMPTVSVLPSPLFVHDPFVQIPYSGGSGGSGVVNGNSYSGFLLVFLVIGAFAVVSLGLFRNLELFENKPVGVLFVVCGAIIFLIMLFAIGVL